MALESFYGGKPGISPVIRASFKYIDTNDPAYKAKRQGGSTKFSTLSPREQALLKQINSEYTENSVITWTDNTLAPFTMDVCFSNPEYRDVWYSELCIIDTENKLNPNNGKIFRRTLKRVETTIGAGDTLYAEYIGQIVGPSGGVPKISFGSVDDVRKQAAGLLATIEDDKMTDEEGNPTYLDISHWDYSYPKNEDGVISTANLLDNNHNENDRENDYEDIWVLESNKNDNAIAMVPGKQKIDDDHIEFKDNIRYTWCNVRRNLTNSDDAWFYLGFEIPYTSWDVEATHIPYWLNTSKGNVVDIQKLNEDDENDHPFYHNLHFYIPRGTRGIGPEELILVKSTINNDTNPPTKTSNHPKDNQDNLVPLYNIGDIQYDSSLDKYSLRQNAQSVDMSNKEDSYWIAKWTLYNPERQAFGQYSKDENDNIIYDADGNNTNLTNANFNGSINAGDQTSYEEVYVYLGEYKDVSGVQLLETGELQIQYSSDISQWLTLNTLKWITDINLDTNLNSDDYGEFTVIYNTYQKDDNNNIIYQKDDNNNIILDNNGNPIPLYEEFSKIIPLIKDIKVDTNRYEKDDEGHIKYDDNNEPIPNDDYGTISVEMSGQENHLVLESKLPFPERISYNKIETIKDNQNQDIPNPDYGKLQFYYTGLSDDDNPIDMEGYINDIVDVVTDWVSTESSSNSENESQEGQENSENESQEGQENSENNNLQKRLEVHLLIKFRDPDYIPVPVSLDENSNNPYPGYPRKIEDGAYKGYVDIGPIGQNEVRINSIPTIAVKWEEEVIVNEELENQTTEIQTKFNPDDNYENLRYYFEKINIDTDNKKDDLLIMPWDNIIEE